MTIHIARDTHADRSIAFDADGVDALNTLAALVSQHGCDDCQARLISGEMPVTHAYEWTCGTGNGNCWAHACSDLTIHEAGGGNRAFAVQGACRDSVRALQEALGPDCSDEMAYSIFDLLDETENGFRWTADLEALAREAA